MTVDHTYIVVIAAVSTLLSTPYCQNVSRDETWAKLNDSAADFHSFIERFHRVYEVNSQQFDRRLLFFQVGDKKRGKFS